MKRYYQIVLAFAIFVTGCAVRYVATYDPTIESDARELQSELSSHFDDLQRTAGTPEGAYDRYATRYADLNVRVSDLQARAALQSRNQLTHESLTFLADNLAVLETAHREGLTAAEVPVLRKLIDAQVRMLLQLESAKKHEPVPAGVTP
jgi:hypothetical protein